MEIYVYDMEIIEGRNIATSQWYEVTKPTTRRNPVTRMAKIWKIGNRAGKLSAHNSAYPDNPIDQSQGFHQRDQVTL